MSKQYDNIWHEERSKIDFFYTLSYIIHLLTLSESIITAIYLSDVKKLPIESI